MSKKVKFGTAPGNTVNIDGWVSSRDAGAGEAPTENTPSVETNAPPPPPEPEPEKLKRLTLDIPQNLHKRIKSKAADEGVPMINLIRPLLEEHFAEENP
jgi:hypothetical protein